MIEYPKIDTPYARSDNGTKKLIEGEWRNETFEYLANHPWRWTEKIDGTNISVEWNGHQVSFYGRTERADIPVFLQTKLGELFLGDTNEEMFEQLFGDNHMILYGEGYGAKIQKGGAKYIPDGVNFILFDVYQPESCMWLKREAVEDIAKALNIDVVPIVGLYTVEEAVEYVKRRPMSNIGTAEMEGVVGVPLGDFKDRRGKRIMMKVKTKDFLTE